MEDDRVWAFEESLWTADDEHYQEAVDDEIVMVLPTPPFVFQGQAAKDAVKATPRWGEVKFSKQVIARPQEGLIVVGYQVNASRDGEAYEAYCTSTYRWIEHGHWRVLQHQQTPPLAAAAEG